MNRPYIICHILSALDGKITGEFMGMESARSVSGEYARIRAQAADGNPDSVTVFEKSPLLPPGNPAAFRLKNIEWLKDDGFRLVYSVISKEKE